MAGWRLDIYGDGPLRSSLNHLVARSNLEDRVAFHGTVPNAALRLALATSDCAVVPSRFDGWGTLVNESMAIGTPVICTDRCGAAIIIENEQAGSVIAAGDAESLAQAMQRAILSGKPTPLARRTVHAMAERHSAKAASEHFLATLTQFT
jgi:glycosyltransferase involved in cell wall biosynthesis